MVDLKRIATHIGPAIALAAGLQGTATAATSLNGPHWVTTHRLFNDALGQIGPVPGGGFIAIGAGYMAFSKGDLGRWRLLPIRTAPHTLMPAYTSPAGGGTRVEYYHEWIKSKTWQWLGDKVAGSLLLALLRGPRLKFVRMIPGSAGPNTFYNSRVGAFFGPGGRNLILTFDGGVHLRPQPPIPNLTGIYQFCWLPRGRIFALAAYRHYLNAVVLQITPFDALRVLWHVPLHIPWPGNQEWIRRFPREYQHGLLTYDQLLCATPGLVWIRWDNNLNAISTRSGKLLVSISGEALTHPAPGITEVPLGRTVKYPASTAPLKRLPPWAWPGILKVSLSHGYIIARDTNTLFGKRRPWKTPSMEIWKLGKTHAHLVLTVPHALAGASFYRGFTLARGKLYATTYQGRIFRIWLRKKKITQLTLHTWVPHRGPWDPPPTIPNTPLSRQLNRELTRELAGMPVKAALRTARMAVKRWPYNYARRTRLWIKLCEEYWKVHQKPLAPTGRARP